MVMWYRVGIDHKIELFRRFIDFTRATRPSNFAISRIDLYTPFVSRNRTYVM